MIAATDVAWLNGAAVLALAGTLAALAKAGWAKIERLHAAQLAAAEAQIEHREALLERMLTSIGDQNDINARMLARLEETHDDDE